MNIQTIKENLSLQAVLQHYGLKIDKNRMLHCPFHEDKKPSMQIYEKTNTAYCFSSNCKLHGKSIDQIDFIMYKEDINKKDAITKAKNLSGIIEEVENKLEESFTELKKSLIRSVKAQKYLKERKLSDINEIGYNYRTLKELKDCIVFPLKDREGKIVSFYGRSVNNTKNGGHYYTANRSGLYPDYPSVDIKTLVIAESIIDALTIKQHTGHAILALYGTNGFNNEHREAIKSIKDLEEIIFFLDGDEAGRKAVAKYSSELHKLLPKVKISMVTTPENEDANSIVQKEEFNLNDLINNRSAIYTEKESIKSEPESIASSLDIKNPDYLCYRNKNIEIIILGGISLYPIDKLKLTLKISKVDSYNPLHKIRHSLDLYNDDQVEKLINKASDKLEISTKELQILLSNLIEELEKYRSKQIELQKPKKVEKRQLTQKRKEAAINWLQKPDLLQRTNELIGKSGVVGEENNRLLMYLIFTSRLKEQPLHIISLGSSGTGKTYLQEKISELIPEEHKLEITTLSENALYYFERQELKNKLVLIEDLDGANDDKVLYAIRELMSKKKISKTIPIKDSKGNLKTITLQVEGPISLSGTTTKEKLYEDNSNRSILIYLDNSRSQKDAIMNYQRSEAAGKINRYTEIDIKEFFKDIQSVLKPIKVINPYAPKLIIPEKVFKPLRTNAHYLNFIEIITFYNQYQRKKQYNTETGEEYIETTLEDIQSANELIKEVLLAKSDELTKAARNFLEMIKLYLKKQQKETFYSKELRLYYRIKPTTLKRYLRELNSYGLIKIISGSMSKGYEYEILEKHEYVKLEEGIVEALKTSITNINNQWATGPLVAHQ